MLTVIHWIQVGGTPPEPAALWLKRVKQRITLEGLFFSPRAVSWTGAARWSSGQGAAFALPGFAVPDPPVPVNLVPLHSAPAGASQDCALRGAVFTR